MYVWHREDRKIRKKRAIAWNALHKKQRSKEGKYHDQLRQLSMTEEFNKLVARDKNVDQKLKICYISCELRKDECRPFMCTGCKFNIRPENNLNIEVRYR